MTNNCLFYAYFQSFEIKSYVVAIAFFVVDKVKRW